MPSKKETRAMGHIMRKKINKHKDINIMDVDQIVINSKRGDCKSKVTSV